MRRSHGLGGNDPLQSHLRERARLEEELATAVSKLDDTRAEKKELENRVADLRRSSYPVTPSSIIVGQMSDLLQSIGANAIGIVGGDVFRYNSVATKAVEFPQVDYAAIGQKVCSRCSKVYWPTVLNHSSPPYVRNVAFGISGILSATPHRVRTPRGRSWPVSPQRSSGKLVAFRESHPPSTCFAMVASCMLLVPS